MWPHPSLGADTCGSLNFAIPREFPILSQLSIKQPIGLFVGAVNALIALSAIAGVAAALLAAAPLWYMLGFELVILVAAAFGLLIAMGRFSDGPALGLLCIVGAVAAGSVLGDLSTYLANPIRGPILHVYGKGGMVELPITLFMTLRLAAAGLVALGAAWIVLSRSPRQALASLWRGLVCAGFLLLLLFAVWRLRSHAAGLAPLVRTLGGITIGVVALALTAAAVHFTIRAFEFGRIHDDLPRPG